MATEPGGLIAVMKDLAAGKSIALPSPAEIESISIQVWARRCIAASRDITDERYHAAVQRMVEPDEDED